MFSLSQTAGYAIQALSRLGKTHPHSMAAKDIAGPYRPPLPHLSKVIHTRKDNGPIEAKRGCRGGFILNSTVADVAAYEGECGPWPPGGSELFQTEMQSAPVHRTEEVEGITGPGPTAEGESA